MSDSDGACTVVSTTMRKVEICDRADWALLLPEHRAARPEWPWWEKPRLDSMWRNLNPGDVLFDIGTEEGDQSALYARWVDNPTDQYRPGGIVLVEPNPKVWANVRAIFEANDIPAPLGCYVGFAGRAVRLGDGAWSEGGAWPACASGPMIGDHGFLNICERPEVRMTTVDSLADSLLCTPDALTIDVEGAELEVLRGARDTLVHDRPLVWVSIHPEFIRDMYGETRDAVIGYMAELGYRHEHLAAEHEHHTLFWHPQGRPVQLPYYGPPA